MADLSAENTLYGVNINKPRYDRGGSREFVLEGVREAVNPLLRQQHAGLAKRGFTGRFYSPTIEAQAIKPVVGQAAESTRRALTDLYYRDEELGLAKRKMTLEERIGGKQMRAMDEQYKGGKVLCTELYRQGLLSFSHLVADYKFLKRHTDKETHENYLRWATPLVDKMQKSKLITYLCLPIVRLWSGYMRAVVRGTRIPISGLLLHRFGCLMGKAYKRLCMVRFRAIQRNLEVS